MTHLPRTLVAAGIALLLLSPLQAAAHAQPRAASADRTVGATADDATPTVGTTAAPGPTGSASPQDSSGCEQEPVICQGQGPVTELPSGTGVATTTACVQAQGPADRGCTAGGVAPAATGGSSLPRTGLPVAVLLSTAAVLLLTGTALVLVGRRRTLRT